MKKRFITAIALCAIMLLTSCASTTDGQAQGQNETGKLSIVASTFYEYDWLLQVLGDRKDDFDVTLLLDSGSDMHSFEPSVQDIVTVSSADLFIYNGGHSQTWVSDTIASPMNDNFRSINIMDSLGDSVQAEVTVEGMQVGSAESAEFSYDEEMYDFFAPCCELTCCLDGTETHERSDSFEVDVDGTLLRFIHPTTGEIVEYTEDNDSFKFAADGALLGIILPKTESDSAEQSHEHDHDEDAHDHDEDAHDHDHDQGHAHDDEHVWLSLNNAMAICAIIGEEVAKLDPDNATVYIDNAENYIQVLSDLHIEYENAIATAARDTLIFADRFPFLYMMQDYDINYYAAFQGCAAETEATFETVKFLSEKIDELEVEKLLIIDNGLTELAETVIENSETKNAETLILHSMQTVTQEEIAAGATYYNYMHENLETLKLALAN